MLARCEDASTATMLLEGHSDLAVRRDETSPVEDAEFVVEDKTYLKQLFHSESGSAKDQLYGQLDCVYQMRVGAGKICKGALTDLGAIFIAIAVDGLQYLCLPGVADALSYVKYLLFLFVDLNADRIEQLRQLLLLRVPADKDADEELAGDESVLSTAVGGLRIGVTTRSQAGKEKSSAGTGAAPQALASGLGKENEWRGLNNVNECALNDACVMRDKMAFLMGGAEQRHRVIEKESPFGDL